MSVRQILKARGILAIVPDARKAQAHGATDLSPVSMAAALHFDIVISNFGIQVFLQGRLSVSRRRPRVCVDHNESLAAKFPYERAYLPVNRKEDGTLFNW